MLRRVVLTRATWRNIPEDTILHSHRRENLKSYIAFGCLSFYPLWCRVQWRFQSVKEVLCYWSELYCELGTKVQAQ
jgi:hypothetical protein